MELRDLEHPITDLQTAVSTEMNIIPVCIPCSTDVFNSIVEAGMPCTCEKIELE